MENLNSIESTELAEMKLEMKNLQENLKRQKIFSDRMMRRAMARRSSWIGSLLKAEVFLILPLVFLCFLFIKMFMGLSWLFFVVTMVFMTGDVIWDFFINRLANHAYSDMSLIELKEKLLERKRMRRLQMVIEVPLVILWAVWFAYDMITNAIGIFEQIPPLVTVGLTGMFLLIGLIGVIILYHKMQNTDNASLAEIEEIRNSDM